MPIPVCERLKEKTVQRKETMMTVETAIVRFTSFSLLPSTETVMKLTIAKIWSGWLLMIPKFKNVKRPAMTRVAECNRLETGVGPSMASGSHKKVVTCTDFRINASRKKRFRTEKLSVVRDEIAVISNKKNVTNAVKSNCRKRWGDCQSARVSRRD